MPAWIRRSLYAVMLLCCVIIGIGVYVELNQVPKITGTVNNTRELKTLPEFSLKDMWGEQHAISEWAGKPLLINFWATWCAPCRREMPLLQALHVSQSELQVLGIAIDRQPDVQTYMVEAGITYPSLVGEEDAMAVSELFGLPGLGLPFTVLVGSDGEILTVFIGEIDARELSKLAETSRAFDEGRIDLVTTRHRLQDL